MLQQQSANQVTPIREPAAAQRRRKSRPTGNTPPTSEASPFTPRQRQPRRRARNLAPGELDDRVDDLNF